ncbi:apolipoprotein D-like isoform X2 [Homalodisca vitripennis]|uniref:apolipoprotein D-like isoform X2 n=1 Tax=Homalodisca vitripennis TaxID=197043 RepID=UPI001EECDAE1|nr:apolipoprotein D-like isoform X2 [Homalodisca vitripennis]XP_046658673.1 apolipoprotein D-like isoform X2 [Homalodisca vitripennis]
MRRILAAALCLSTLLVQGEAFSWPHWGKCRELPVVEKFKFQKYMYHWYEQAGYNTEATNHDLRCPQSFYQPDTTTVFTIQSKAVRNRDNKTQGINGTGLLADPTKDEGRMIVTFHPHWWSTVTGNYWVLGTDYITYSVVYTCENFLFFFHYDSIWYLSRLRTLRSKTDFFTSTDRILLMNGLDPTIMQGVSQSNCND